MQSAHASPSVTTHAAAQADTIPAHSNHSPVSQCVFSHEVLHELSQLQQKMLHGPFPQHPKSGLRLQQSPATRETIANSNTMELFMIEWVF
jgi:hypothetical protein